MIRAFLSITDSKSHQLAIGLNNEDLEILKRKPIFTNCAYIMRDQYPRSRFSIGIYWMTDNLKSLLEKEDYYAAFGTVDVIVVLDPDALDMITGGKQKTFPVNDAQFPDLKGLTICLFTGIDNPTMVEALLAAEKTMHGSVKILKLTS